MKNHRKKPIIGALLVTGCLWTFGAAEDPGQKTAAVRSFAVKNARVFDGEKLIEGATVVVRDGKIFSVGLGPEGFGDGPVLDARGQTLLPGLFDAHVHTWSDDQLRQAAIFGVTTVIDMFMSPAMMKTMKETQAGRGALDRAFLVSPGVLATVSGGHGTQFGVPIPTIEPAADIRAYVDDRIAEGSDFIKIIQDDGSAYRFPRPTLSDAQVAALIEAAHARGKKAIIHAALLKNCLAALNAGVDGLAHLYFEDAADPDFGALAARKNAFVIPTLSVLRGMSGIGDNGQLAEDGHLAPFLKPEDFSGLNAAMGFKSGAAAYAAAEKALRQLKAAGVPILAGTDAPNPGTTCGASLHGELALLVKAGLSPLDALRAATSVPADHFGLKDRGRIRSGMMADLVLVNGDPSQDIRATRDIVQVWRGGVALNREAYRRTVRELRDQAADAKSAPSPEYGIGGMISDFERGKIEAAFGTGWVVSTDVFYGGKSKAVMEWTAGGAQGSQGAMKISGEIMEGAPNRFAGAMFSPGRAMMQPVNLSNRKAVTFWAKAAAPRTCVFDLFVQSRGFQPVMATFLAGPEWKEYSFSFTDLKIDGAGLMAVFIGAVQDLGPFTIYIDNVRFQ